MSRLPPAAWRLRPRPAAQGVENKRCYELNEEEINKIREEVGKYTTEADLVSQAWRTQPPRGTFAVWPARGARRARQRAVARARCRPSCEPLLLQQAGARCASR